MLISIYMFQKFPNSDPGRIAAQVVTGIGFLGAGTIIRQGNIVIGLTTAASLWAVAAVGLTVGAGFYSAGVIGTLMIYLSLTVFKNIEMWLIAPRREVEHHTLVIQAKRAEGQLGRLETLLATLGVEIVNLDIQRVEDELSVIRMDLRLPAGRSRERVTADVQALKGVTGVRWEEYEEGPRL